MKAKLCIATCEHFQQEVLAALAQREDDDLFAHVSVVSFSSRCACRLSCCDTQALEFAGAETCSHVHLLGGPCLNNLPPFPDDGKKYCLSVFSHCFDMVADRIVIQQHLAQGLNLLLPGWMAHWRRWLRKWNLEDEMIAACRHADTRFLLLDTGTYPNIAASLQEFAAFTGCQATIFPIGLDFLRLLLTNIVMSWQVEQERQETAEVRDAAQKQSAEYAMAIDLLNTLTSTAAETDAIRHIIDVFSMLFAAKDVFYIPFRDGEPDKTQSSYSSKPIDTASVLGLINSSQEYAWASSGEGFFVRIRRRNAPPRMIGMKHLTAFSATGASTWDDTLGILGVDRIAFPQYQRHYLNLALSITNVCSLVIDNARTYEKIRETETELRKLSRAVEQSANSVVITDREGTIEFVNPAFTRVTGYTSEEALGQNPRILKSDKHAPEFYQRLWNTLARGEVWSGEFINKHKNGEFYWESATISPLKNQDGEITHFLAIKENITARKQAEEALKAAKEAAESANKAKSAFLANMSHELRTPLNAILGYTQILHRDQGLTEQQLNKIAVIHRSGEHLLTLLNDILDISKIEAGKMELHAASLPLRSFLMGIVEMIQFRAQQKSVSFDYEFSTSLPTVYADEKRLRQVLLNLLSNAVKFTEQGSILFRVKVQGARYKGQEIYDRDQETSQQEPKTFSQNYPSGFDVRNSRLCALHFEIEDSGIGIPTEQVQEIFLPFRQLGDTLRKSEGTGLGLAISRKLVMMMGGELHVESVPGEGSLFWFELTLPEVGEESSAESQPSSARVIGFTGTPRRILLVDDIPTNLMVLEEFLAPLGFALTTAVNGEEAVKQALHYHPDLILMDLVMPGIDGLEATRRIRQHAELHDITIIAISANVFEQTRQEGLRAGCNGFITKPFQQETLLELLGRHLNLEWVYAREPGRESSASGQTSLAFSMTLPPTEELERLFEFAQDGDIIKVQQQNKHIEQLGTQYAAFVAQVHQYTQQFQIDALNKFIRRSLEAASS